MISLRACDEFDALSVAELRAASLVELALLPAGDVDAFVGSAARAFGRLFRSDRIAAWIACDDERAVASACAVFYDRLPYPDGSRHAEVCGVYVRPAYRRRGYASELVGEVVGSAQAAGARKIFLRPAQGAKALYSRLGFRDTDLMTFVGARERPQESGPILAALARR